MVFLKEGESCILKWKRRKDAEPSSPMWLQGQQNARSQLLIRRRSKPGENVSRQETK
jgi:hypothetical protein